MGIALCRPMSFPCDAARGFVTAGGLHGQVTVYSVCAGYTVCKGGSLRKRENWEVGGSQFKQQDKLKEIQY